MWLYIAIHKGKIPTLSDMALKQQLKTAEMATNWHKDGLKLRQQGRKTYKQYLGRITVKRLVCIILEYFSLIILSKCHSILKINTHSEVLGTMSFWEFFGEVRIFATNKSSKGKC